MKVLMFGWEFPPHISGGLGTACYGLTKGLSHFDIDLDFVIPKAYGGEDSSHMSLTSADDIDLDFTEQDVLAFENEFKILSTYTNLRPYMHPDLTDGEKSFYESQQSLDNRTIKLERGCLQLTGKYTDRLLEEVHKYALVAENIAKKRSFDIIHAHDWLAYPAGIAAKKASGKKLVIHVHATEHDRTGEKVYQAVYDIERLGMEAADRIIVVSNLTKNVIVTRYGIDPQKIDVVYNAVDINKENEFYVPKKVKEKLVTFLGRVTFQKGPGYFIEAAKLVLDFNDNVRFVMAGSGDMLPRMIKRVADLHLSDKFHFAGFLKDKDVYRMLNQSDLFVMPSISEPFGIVPLEAMSSNVPIIISKQSGVAEVLRYAIKVDFWDIQALADAIYGLVTYLPLEQMFRAYGKDEVKALKWENSAFNVINVYKKVLNRG